MLSTLMEVSNMSRFLSNIGQSDDLRKLVSEVDVSPTTISLVLDRLRTLEVIHKTAGKTELIVQCRDADDRTTVVLHLPYEANSVGQATIITYNPEGS